MNKTETIEALSIKAGISKNQASITLNSFIELIQDELKKGGEVNITGFGTFKVTNRAARNGVNPQTKEKILIPESKSPVFKAGKTFKELIK